jgi:hypothetical protein
VSIYKKPVAPSEKTLISPALPYHIIPNPLPLLSMKSAFIAVAAASTVGSAYAQGQAYAQCGGSGWSGSTSCVSGYTCTKTNDYYSQCLPGGSNPTTTTRPSTTTTSRTGGSSPTGGSGSGRVSNAGVNVSGS